MNTSFRQQQQMRSLIDNPPAARADIPPIEIYHNELPTPKTTFFENAKLNNDQHLPLDLRRQLCNQNLFIFHLPSDWRETDIKQAFGAFGKIISAKVVKRPDGSSKGYGFVCFELRESALVAMERMNGYAVGGKRLKVSLKKTPEECLNLQVQRLLRMSDQNESFERERDCSLFVFHLPPHWDDKDLRDQFLQFGPVVTAKVSRKEDGTSRGYGFVTCTNPRSAAMAIIHLNGMEVCNKRLKVQPKQVGDGAHPRPDCTVFVFHLPNDWTDSILKQFFSPCGRVVSATVQRDSKGRSRGFGFVTYERAQSAREAINALDGAYVGLKRLKVSLKRTEGMSAGNSGESPVSCAAYGQHARGAVLFPSSVATTTEDVVLEGAAATTSDGGNEDWQQRASAEDLFVDHKMSDTWAPETHGGGGVEPCWKSLGRDVPPAYSYTPTTAFSAQPLLLSALPPRGQNLIAGRPVANSSGSLLAYTSPFARGGAPPPPIWGGTPLGPIPFAATHPNLTNANTTQIGNGTPYNSPTSVFQPRPLTTNAVLGRRTLRTS